MLLLISISLFSFHTYSQSGLSKKLSVKLDSLREVSGYPGVVFAYVTQDGQPRSIPSGWADVENKIAMTSDHLMHSGSTGKTIVSALTMLLVIDGKIELNKTAKSYLGDYAWWSRVPNADSITVTHLLNHSSGIQRYEFKEEFLAEVVKKTDKFWKPEDLIQFILDDEPLFEAGKGFSYADTNDILAGMIIEKVTGENFYALAQRRILKPLNLESFIPTNTRSIKNLSQGYYDEGSQYGLGFKSPFLKDGKTQNNMQWEWTGGGYAYKTHEYAQLLKYIYEGEVFDLDQVKDVFPEYIESPQIRGEYGLGVHKLTLPNIGEVIGHSGFFPGYNTAGFYHPESGMSFAMQINMTNLPQLQKFFSDYMIMINSVLSEIE